MALFSAKVTSFKFIGDANQVRIACIIAMGAVPVELNLEAILIIAI